MNIGKVFMLASTTLALAGTAPATQASDSTWDRANLEYQVQRYDRALALYEQLAEAGDPRAAELAGHMLIFGETLYGGAVPRDPVRAARWLAQAAEADRPLARHLLIRLNREGGEHSEGE